MIEDDSNDDLTGDNGWCSANGRQMTGFGVERYPGDVTDNINKHFPLVSCNLVLFGNRKESYLAYMMKL